VEAHLTAVEAHPGAVCSPKALRLIRSHDSCLGAIEAYLGAIEAEARAMKASSGTIV
jgi:hypothetical protein